MIFWSGFHVKFGTDFDLDLVLDSWDDPALDGWDGSVLNDWKGSWACCAPAIKFVDSWDNSALDS